MIKACAAASAEDDLDPSQIMTLFESTSRTGPTTSSPFNSKSRPAQFWHDDCVGLAQLNSLAKSIEPRCKPLHILALLAGATPQVIGAPV